jgi:hypothetical protein
VLEAKCDLLIDVQEILSLTISVELRTLDSRLSRANSVLVKLRTLDSRLSRAYVFLDISFKWKMAYFVGGPQSSQGI